MKSQVKTKSQKVIFECTDCGVTTPKWTGKCGACGEWNTLVEAPEIPSAQRSKSGQALVSPPVSLVEALADPAIVLPTGLSELDRVLSGGLVRGSVTLLGGEPGIGKSTLILQLCGAIAAAGGKCLIATGEESVDQVARRAQRLRVQSDSVMLMAASDVDAIIAELATQRPALVIIDSIQTMALSGVSSAAGSVTQVRESAAALTAYAKEHHIAMVLVGHVTKEGALAGPRVLEHLVDTVIEFEGDRHHNLRFLRAVKHRFGATDEVGVFDMTIDGLQSVADASGLFLDDRQSDATGSVVVPILNGRRSMLVEVQALVAESDVGRRVTQGFDNSRLALVAAAMSKHLDSSLGRNDVYASIVGGLRTTDPATELGLALSLWSSEKSVAIPHEVVAVGEVGLGGEIRKVPQLEKRLREAARLGFTVALIPRQDVDEPEGLTVIRVPTLSEATNVCRKLGRQVQSLGDPKKAEGRRGKKTKADANTRPARA